MVSDISVIICAYTEKRWNELLTAIQSVQNQTLPPREIIVVIDHNPDLLLRLQENVPGIIAMENGQAKGASGARNSGAKTARGTVLAFLDDDAIAHADWLEKLAACYTSQRVVGVGGKIEPLWDKQRPPWFPGEFHWVVGCSYRGLPGEVTAVRNVIGANMSVRKDILMAAGGFRESFGNDKSTEKTRASSRWFHHHAGDEETEFCMRVTQQLSDSDWLYTPSAVVQHFVPLQRTRWNYFLWRCYDEGLGKASLVKLHSTATGLSSERTYTLKTLPKGVLRGLADFLQGDLTGALRAGAIVIGLEMTTLGYLVGSISLRIPTGRDANLTRTHHHPVTETEAPIEVQR